MKDLKKIILLFTGIFLVSCGGNPNYEKNLPLAKKWIEAFETGNIALWKEVVSENLVDVAPMYGMGEVDYNTSLQVAEFYVQNYSNVKFKNQVWLPGIDTLTMKPDGSVRAYGNWTGKSKSTGRDFSMFSYHNFDFKDGKIVSRNNFKNQNRNVLAYTSHAGPLTRCCMVVVSSCREVSVAPIHRPNY